MWSPRRITSCHHTVHARISRSIEHSSWYTMPQVRKVGQGMAQVQGFHGRVCTCGLLHGSMCTCNCVILRAEGAHGCMHRTRTNGGVRVRAAHTHQEGANIAKLHHDLEHAALIKDAVACNDAWVVQLEHDAHLVHHFLQHATSTPSVLEPRLPRPAPTWSARGCGLASHNTPTTRSQQLTPAAPFEHPPGVYHPFPRAWRACVMYV